MQLEQRPGALDRLSDDRLGAAAVSVVVSELQWSPDVAPAVLDRIARDAVAYPELLARRPGVRPAVGPSVPGERSARRALGRLVVFGLIIVVIVAIVAFAATASAAAAEAGGGVSEGLERLEVDLVQVADGFDQPVLVTHAGDGTGTLYVVEQTGRVWPIASDGTRAETPFLDLSDAVVVSYEQGLLGLAFHPGYAANGRLYVNYTRTSDGATVVSELTATEGLAEGASERVLLTITQPFANHNGGGLAFDSAGMLLVGAGDGGAGGDPLGSGQDPESLLGKLLRLDVDGDAQPYGIPPDNGFAGEEGYRPEIHALGLRNPWRFSVDPVGGHVYVGDVGQGSWEEIDVLPAGRGGQSFGWNEVEGPECFVAGCDLTAHTPPAISYGHDEGCTVVGGHVYRGSRQPGLEGVYVFGDYCSGTIWGAAADEIVAGEAARVPIGALDGTLVSFGVDESGELLAVDLGGSIFHLVSEGS